MPSRGGLGSTFDGRGISGAALYGGFKLAPETVRNCGETERENVH